MANAGSWSPSQPRESLLNSWHLIKDLWVFADNSTGSALNTRHSTRAWTLQEEFMSVRKLFWTHYGLVWSCSTRLRREWVRVKRSGSPVDVKVLRECFPDFVQRRYAAFVHRNASSYGAKKAWTEALTVYLPRSITKSNDRLAAIGGLVKALQPQIQDKYVGGLWLNSISEDLLWGVAKSTSDDLSRRQPSWSWASLPAHCTAHAWLGYPLSETVRRPCTVESIDIHPSDRAIFGPITSGRLRILTKKTAFPSSAIRCYLNASMGGSWGPNYESSNHYIAVDIDSGKDEFNLDRFECLKILDFLGGEFCLLVEVVDPGSVTTSFRRLGRAEIFF
jgi:hypothetical protein